MRICALLLASAGLLVGCMLNALNPKGPRDADIAAKQFRPPAGKARVYVYRTGGGGQGVIVIDGAIVGDVSPRRYVFADVEPGLHRISAQWEGPTTSTRELTLDAASDAVYFFRYSGLTWNFKLPSVSLASEADGRKAIQRSSLARAPSQ
jgi:uncharacterized protein DUF2846